MCVEVCGVVIWLQWNCNAMQCNTTATQSEMPQNHTHLIATLQHNTNTTLQHQHTHIIIIISHPHNLNLEHHFTDLH